MSGPDGQLTPGPGAKIIPLMPGVARPSGGAARGAARRGPAGDHPPGDREGARRPAIAAVRPGRRAAQQAGLGAGRAVRGRGRRARTQRPVPGAGTGDLGPRRWRPAAQRGSGPDLGGAMAVQRRSGPCCRRRAPPRQRTRATAVARTKGAARTAYTPRATPLPSTRPRTPGRHPEPSQAVLDTNLRGGRPRSRRHRHSGSTAAASSSRPRRHGRAGRPSQQRPLREVSVRPMGATTGQANYDVVTNATGRVFRGR